MKYQKGDRVFIKPWKMMKEEYGANYCSGSIKTPRGFSKKMEKEFQGRNRIVTITSVHGDYAYDVILDGATKLFGWNVDDEMIAGYAFDWGEEIEVKDCGGQSWRTEKSVGFGAGANYPYHCWTYQWKMARPIREPKIEIDVRVNGEAVSLSKLSEETLLRIRKESNG